MKNSTTTLHFVLKKQSIRLVALAPNNCLFFPTLKVQKLGSVKLDFQVTDNTAKKQYEATIEGIVARIEYIKAQDKIYLTHTEVPKALEGKGLGSSLVAKVLEDVDRQNLTLIPLCPFVALYLKRHPEWKRLIMKGINIE